MNNSIFDGFSLSSFNYDSADCYKEARDAYLRRTFLGYPHCTIDTFSLSFRIATTAKNGPILYDILDTIPDELLAIEKNTITITILSEGELVNQIEKITDILTITKSWTSTLILVNDIVIGPFTEFGYLEDFLYEKYGLEKRLYRKTVDEVKNKYKPHKIISKPQKNYSPIAISRHNVEAAFSETINTYISIYGNNKEIKRYTISPHDMVILIEDSLVIDFRLLPWYLTGEIEKNSKEWEFPFIVIQELTPNALHKFNFSDFKRHFKCDYIGIEFLAYHGVHYYRDEIDNFNTVDRKLPGLKLQERCNNYPGETHHFVLLRMEDVNGGIVYGIGDTKGKVYSFVLKLCKELEEKNSRSLELNGASCLPYKENRQFINAFLSWKGKKKRWRLENKFSYYYEDKQIKNDLDLYVIPGEIVTAAQNGLYDSFEFGYYNKPANKWKSEELVYNITKKLYKEYQVIYQYKPYYLATENGNMSYDIYICGLKIAIEYQGKQHFEPVEYFGGEESFKKQKERDELKAQRSKENGVRLIYVNYWEDITPDLIRGKIKDVL